MPELMLLLKPLLWFLAAAMISYLAYRARALSSSGAVAACFVGGAVLGFGGVGWAVLLVLFFTSSSILSFFKANDTRKVTAAATFDKGGRRDAAQVLANGGVASAIALANGLAMLFLSGISTLDGNTYSPLLLASYAGALAAANADTWATEIGVLSTQSPRMVTTGRIVPAGTSGAITWVGSLAAMAGALLIGLGGAIVMYLSPIPAGNPFLLLVAAFVGGTIGSTFDSLLGATLQANYWCPQCQKATESRLHRCGTPTQLTHGITALNNDVVNLLATIAGAVVAGAVYSRF